MTANFEGSINPYLWKFIHGKYGIEAIGTTSEEYYPASTRVIEMLRDFDANGIEHDGPQGYLELGNPTVTKDHKLISFKFLAIPRDKETAQTVKVYDLMVAAELYPALLADNE